jgi:prevent-host-death family protein
MQHHIVRKISSSKARANLGDVLSSLNTHGPIEITRNGKSVALLKLPPAQDVDRSRVANLAIAYSKGLISWPEIAEETGASYGELLIELGLKNLQIPKVIAKNRPEQIAIFHRILESAAKQSEISDASPLLSTYSSKNQVQKD